MRGFSIAVDVGAGSVKALATRFDGEALRFLGTKEFRNETVQVLGSLYVDAFGVFGGIKKLIAEFQAELGRCACIGIDTYGNGYGILDSRGRLLGMPYHYRDDRTIGVLEEIAEIVPLADLYRSTGIYPERTRVLMQLYRDARDGTISPRDTGKTFLPFANLLNYFLTGERTAERTIASVGCLLDVNGYDWNRALFDRLGIPGALFPRIVDSGTVAGTVSRAYSAETGADGARVVNVCCHDTESALLAAPIRDERVLFLSAGTSFIFGCRTARPVITDTGFRFQFKNVAGAFGSNSLCKDFPGFWLLNKCMDEWRSAGTKVTYDDLEALVSGGAPNSTYIDVCDPIFRANPESMIGAIRDYCRGTGQPDVESIQEIAKCLFESCALQVRSSFESLKIIAGRDDYTELAVVSGGTRSGSLMQMIADATGVDVIAGSPFASSVGNALAQLYAEGELASLSDISAVALRSCPTRAYRSQKSGKWDDAIGFIGERGFATQADKR